MNAIDYAGAIDSGLLQYQGWRLKDDLPEDYQPSTDSVTVFISAMVTSDKLLTAEDINSGLIDAFENNACHVDRNENHTVYLTIRGVISDRHIHEV